MTALQTLKRILICDASPDPQIVSILKQINYEVESVSSPKEGIEALSSSNADLILVAVADDSNLKDVCAKIRKAGNGKGARLLIMGPQKLQEKKFKDVQGKSDGADAFVPLLSPYEDIVDQVEQLIGLPPTPKGRSNGDDIPTLEPMSDDERVREMQRELESMQEQVQFYQRQLDQVSVTGEKESRHFDQVLKDLQDNLDKSREAGEGNREELRLLKADLSQKDREIVAKEKEIGDLREQLKEVDEELRGEIDQLRATLNESKEQHKKAQNALREYYKAKVDKNTAKDTELKDLKSKCAQLEKAQHDAVDKLSGTTSALSRLNKELDQVQAENKTLKAQVEEEREKAQKAKAKLDQLKKALE
jgi:hypothetical protein